MSKLIFCGVIGGIVEIDLRSRSHVPFSRARGTFLHVERG